MGFLTGPVLPVSALIIGNSQGQVNAKRVLVVPLNRYYNYGMLDREGKGLEVGDIVHHENEDGEWIVLHIDDASIQLAELGEGIIAKGTDVHKLDHLD